MAAESRKQGSDLTDDAAGEVMEMLLHEPFCFSFFQAVRLLQHALWIHPGYLPARQDLEALAAFHEDAAIAGDPDQGQQSASRFEMLDDERQGQLWPDEDLEGWERAEGEFPDDDADERAA